MIYIYSLFLWTWGVKMRIAVVVGLMGLMVGCSSPLSRNELVGEWQSNKRRTLEYLDSNQVLTPQQRAFLEPNYGKLVFSATDTEVTISWTDGSSPTQTYPYTYTREGNKYTVNVDNRLFIYTMEGDCMWVDLAGGLREYFCRVE